MKKCLTALVMCFAITVASSQTDSSQLFLDRVFQSMRTDNALFNCKEKTEGGVIKKAKAVSEPAFDSMYLLASTRILSSAQDFVKNGKVATLDFNEGLKRLTINYSWRTRGKTIINTGFIAEDAGKKLFEIFGKDGWKEGFTFNLGVVRPFGKRTIYFLPSSCRTLEVQRQGQYLQLINKYHEVLGTSEAAINSIRARKTAFESANLSGLTDFRAAPQAVSENELKLLAQWDSLVNYRNNPASWSKLSEVYQKAMLDFEVANFKKFGYRVKWVNFNIAPSLNRLSVYDTAVVRLAAVEKKSLFRVTATASYNLFTEVAKGRINYLSFEASVGNTDYLAEITQSEITELKASINNETIKNEYEALVIKDYQRLKGDYAFVGLGIAWNFYPGFKERFFGFEVAGSTRLKFGEPSGIKGRDIFSLRAGPLFTFEKDKIAKTTFGILATFTDIPFNDLTMRDRFGINIRIGVPFNY